MVLLLQGYELSAQEWLTFQPKRLVWFVKLHLQFLALSGSTKYLLHS